MAQIRWLWAVEKPDAGKAHYCENDAEAKKGWLSFFIFLNDLNLKYENKLSDIFLTG